MFSWSLLSFTSPWFLLGLLFLPVVWWLLSVIPRKPRQVPFPPIDVLRSLQQKTQKSSQTPWWLIALRVLIVGCIIVTLAAPIFDPAPQLSGKGVIVLLVDNGWTSARPWAKMYENIQTVLDQAQKTHRPILLITTAQQTENTPLQPVIRSAPEVRRMISGLSPKPWPVDRRPASLLLSENQTLLADDSLLLWITDGLNAPGTQELLHTFPHFDHVEVRTPPSDLLPYLLTLLPTSHHPLYTVNTPSQTENNRNQTNDPLKTIHVVVHRVQSETPASVVVRLLAADDRLLERVQGSFTRGQTQITLSSSLPTPLRKEISRIQLENTKTASTTFLLDHRWYQHNVGLIVGCQQTQAHPLLHDEHYLKKALSPYASVQQYDLNNLNLNNISLLILTDVSPLSPQQHTILEQWVEQGGIVVRFAGPCLASNPDSLLPVKLLTGDRSLGGVLSWSQPTQLESFSQHSPLHDLIVPQDMTVYRQVLAQPSVDLPQKTWAQLTDGTPLITANKNGKGYLILIHTTASPNWSQLPLSGLFVQILRKLIELSTYTAAGVLPTQETLLPPLSVLDAFGELKQPPSTATPLNQTTLHQTLPSPIHPPGYYGHENLQIALNLGDNLKPPQPLNPLPTPAVRNSLDTQQNINLIPSLLVLTLLLLLLDIAIMLLLYGNIRYKLTSSGYSGYIKGLFLLLLLVSPPRTAASETVQDWKASLDTYLAYIQSHSTENDRIVQLGLQSLSAVISRRTSIQVKGVIRINPEVDKLSYFPLIYWIMTPEQPPLSPKAYHSINQYLRNGGLILFDTRNHYKHNLTDLQSLNLLQQILKNLSIPPLHPITPQHTLTKSFYLLNTFPGRYNSSQLLVTDTQERQSDGVSSVIIGYNDWASAWAVDEAGRGLFAMIPGGERQREMAYRFGINILMYALTGNYKSDQVHVSTILKRRQTINE